MQISLNSKSDTEVTLTIVAAESELTPLRDMVLNRFRKEVKIPGFRQGKAPLSMVEKNVNPEALQSEFLDEAINQMYYRAVVEKRIRAISNPNVKITKFVPFTVLEFEAEVEAVGDIKLPDYKKVKKTKSKVSVTVDDVQGVLKTLQQRMADKKDVDRAAKADDVAWIDFTGVDEKAEPIQGADGKNYPLSLGSNTFIPGFEDNVIGMKAGDEKTFDLKFPKDYGVKALANKKVTFTVTVIKVQEAIELKLDDEFAAKAGPFDSLQALKDDIKVQLSAEKQQEVDRAFEDELLQELADKTKVAVPASLVEAQLDRLETEERQNLAYRGQTWEEHLKDEGITAEEHRKQKRDLAERQVKVGLLLAEVSEQENITVSDDEFDVRMQLLRNQYQDKQMQAELDKPENQRDIRSRMITEKTLIKLTEYATSK